MIEDEYPAEVAAARTRPSMPLSDESRLEVYGFMLDLLKPRTVAVCKEADEMVTQLGLKNIRCNCIW
jgi:hypothetical protein